MLCQCVFITHPLTTSITFYLLQYFCVFVILRHYLLNWYTTFSALAENSLWTANQSVSDCIGKHVRFILKWVNNDGFVVKCFPHRIQSYDSSISLLFKDILIFYINSLIGIFGRFNCLSTLSFYPQIANSPKLRTTKRQKEMEYKIENYIKPTDCDASEGLLASGEASQGALLTQET